MATLETAFEIVKRLVSDFKANEPYYLSYKYSESEVRQDYIDKFLVALNWDVSHKTQKNPYEQEVKVEKGVKVGRAQKRADYAFHLAPNFRDPKFFVEAKKPARPLSNPDDYFQAIRYGWNANTPVVILTDFEEFHIIDSRFKPDIDTALSKKLQYFHYSEYADKEKFAQIYYLFSHEAVGNNSIETYAESLPKPKGKAAQKQLSSDGFKSIDESFLEEIDEIRISLARAYKKSNPSMQGYELTEAIHRTIDRLVFIRFLEDKIIEPEHYISEFGKSSDAWEGFLALSKRLNAKYNGVVFKHHIIDEKDFIKPKDVFINICQDLSHLKSSYDFDKIPIHILGSIYERFLGKVVHATSKRVTIEDKPEVKKAGGVYYTPQYIVRYIVANTVGKLIEGKTPLQISRLRFVDISCGSGSFLIAVFEALLDYHGNWYQNNPAKAKSDGCFHQDGKWILSLQQKKKILLNNIYGVDIDSQAVEVTQLSLCLKLMEDESTATANEMQVLFHEQILPDLTKNIVCGNSLIEWDIEDSQQFPDEEMQKLNPMDFENAFEDIMKDGGFDAVVGNPPYVDNRGYDKKQLEYFYKKYISFTKAGTQKFKTRKFNTFVAFLERVQHLLKSKGKCGYIVHKNLLKTTTYKGIRNFILDSFDINKIVDWGAGQFKGVTAETISIFLEKGNSNKNEIIIEFYSMAKKINQNKIDQKIYYETYDNIFNINISTHDIKLIQRIERNKEKLIEFVNINNGIVTGNDKELISDSNISNKHVPCVTGKNIKRYFIQGLKGYVLYDPKILLRSRNKEIFDVDEKLIMQMININLILAYDNQQFYNLGTTYSITKKIDTINLKYILALLNSKLLNYYYLKKFTNESTLTNAISTKNLFEFPIPKIDFKNKTEKAAHDKIVQLADLIIETKNKLATAKMDRDINYYERKCSNIDREINNEVYKLYGLSEHEIKIVNSG